MIRGVEKLTQYVERAIKEWKNRVFSSNLWRYLFILTIAAVLSTAAVVMADDWWYVYPPYPIESERFGVGLAGSAESVLQYDLEALGVGWYLNWNIALNPPHPYGTGFMQTIRLDAGNLSELQSIEMVIAASQAWA
jgi:hypothetical protein